MADDLISVLNAKLDKLNNLDPDWVVFITDHKLSILNNSIPVYMTDADRDRYRHKFDHYLRNYECEATIRWIAVFINDLSMYEDFTNKAVIFLPDRTYITNLYREYRTSKNMT